ncbi:MFS transporter [Microtetraspora fusca]|uniref:MFS transporter n=1 Tax=Microtetraspora fusca TaxID=1997 RepID=A0ABW6V8V3_MICFU
MSNIPIMPRRATEGDRSNPSTSGPASGHDEPRARGLPSTAVLAVGTFAVGTDAFVVAGFLPDMAASLNVTPATAGQSVTVFAAAYAVVSPILATVTARIPRRALLVGALVLLGLANLGSALSPSFPVLIGTRILAAAGAAAFTPNAGAVAATLVRPEARARALAVVVGGLTVATALGVPLGDVIGRWLGWRGALGTVAAMCLLVAAAVAVTMPMLPGGPQVALRTRLAVLRRPAVLTVLPLTVLGMAAAYSAYAYIVPALRAMDIGESSTVWMLFLYGAGAVLGNLAAGYATDRWGSVRVLSTGYLTMAAGLALLAWMAASGIALPAVAGLLVLVWGGSSWCQTPPQQHRLITAAPQEAPLVVSLNSSAIYTGIGAGTLLGGLTLPHGTPLVYLSGAALAAVALIFLLVTARKGSPSS